MEEKKTKYIGVRLTYAQYCEIIQQANMLGVSITDFVLPILLKEIDKTGVRTSLTKQENNEEKKNVIPEPNLKKEQKKIESKSDDESLAQLDFKMRKYSHVLHNLKLSKNGKQ